METTGSREVLGVVTEAGTLSSCELIIETSDLSDGFQLPSDILYCMKRENLVLFGLCSY